MEPTVSDTRTKGTPAGGVGTALLQLGRRRGLRLLTFGFEAGSPEPETIAALTEGFGRSIGLRVFDIFTSDREWPQHFMAQCAQVLVLVADGELDPQIDRVFDLVDAAAAHEHLAAGTVRGKVLLGIPRE